MDMESWWKLVGEESKKHLKRSKNFFAGPITLGYMKYLEKKVKKLEFSVVRLYCREFINSKDIEVLIFLYYSD